MLNEDRLVRVLESMERDERHRPRADAWISAFSIFVAILLVLATSTFHSFGPIGAGDVRTIAVVAVVVSLGLAVFWFVRWGRYVLTHLTPETAEQKVAKLKLEAKKLEDKLRAADEEAAINP